MSVMHGGARDPIVGEGRDCPVAAWAETGLVRRGHVPNTGGPYSRESPSSESCAEVQDWRIGQRGPDCAAAGLPPVRYKETHSIRTLDSETELACLNKPRRARRIAESRSTFVTTVNISVKRNGRTSVCTIQSATVTHRYRSIQCSQYVKCSLLGARNCQTAFRPIELPMRRKKRCPTNKALHLTGAGRSNSEYSAL